MSSLRDIATVAAGNSAPQHKDLFDGGIYPFVRTSDVGKIRFGAIADSNDKLNDTGRRGLRIFPPGTILMPKSGASTFLNHRVMLDTEAYVSSHLAAIVPRETVVPKFLLYFLRTIDARDLVQDQAYPSLNLPTIQAVRVPVPALEEQRRIVEALDQTFLTIEFAEANCLHNVESSAALLASTMQREFGHSEGISVCSEDEEFKHDDRGEWADNLSPSRTKGRSATTRVIAGGLSLSVGMPNVAPKPGWKWVSLDRVARLESGHTPSRRHPEYWDGGVGWLGIKDARENHGGIINQTSQSISELGLQNSSARLLPIGTICLSRTASVGYVVKLGASMATSQDFINWVCSDGLDPDFLKYIFLAEGRDGLLRYGSGSVHQTIYYPEAKAFHVCIPSVDVQRKIVGMLDELSAEVNRLSGTYTQKLGKLSELRNAVMAAAFAGELGGTKEAA